MAIGWSIRQWLTAAEILQHTHAPADVDRAKPASLPAVPCHGPECGRQSSSPISVPPPFTLEQNEQDRCCCLSIELPPLLSASSYLPLNDCRLIAVDVPASSSAAIFVAGVIDCGEMILALLQFSVCLDTSRCATKSNICVLGGFAELTDTISPIERSMQGDATWQLQSAIYRILLERRLARAKHTCRPSARDCASCCRSSWRCWRCSAQTRSIWPASRH